MEAAGAGVTGLATGDFVILNWRAVCGQCRACRRGRPWYCFATRNAAQKMTLADGTIIAVGIDPRKLEWARQFGATHVINSRETGPVEQIRALTGGNGAGLVIEAIGRPETYEQAFYARDLAGTVVLVGVPTPDMRLDLPLLDFFGRGSALKSSWYGDCLPERDFPMLTDLYLQGRLPLEKFVSETIALDAVEDAYTKMERGEVRAAVLELAAGAGIGCDVGHFSMTQFYAADEVFVTGTMGGLTPVTAIDGRTIGTGSPGSVTRRLTAMFADLTARSGTLVV